MSDESAFVSVILPVHNGAVHLAAAIDSVLSQPHRPMEVLVVDDGSTDESHLIATGYGDPVRCFRQSNRGPAAARNLGLEMAAGKLIGFIDADDLWLPGKLRCQLDLLTTMPNVMGVRGRVQRFADADMAPLGQPWAALHLGSGLFRRAAFDSIGLLDETQRFSEDVDWFMRAEQAGLPILVHPEVVLSYRRHDRNLTRDRVAARRGFLQATAKAVRRAKLRGRKPE